MNTNTLRRLNWLWKHRHTHDNDEDCCAQLPELRLQIETAADILQHTQATAGALDDTAVTYFAASGTSHTWPIPTNVVQGDHIYVFIATVDSDDGIDSMPSGYTKIGEMINSAFSPFENHTIWYKVADGTETDTTFTTVESCSVALIARRIAAPSGGSLGVPKVAGPTLFVSGANPDPPSVTPDDGPGDYAVHAVVTGNNAASNPPIVPPSGYTDLAGQVYAGGGGLAASVYVADATKAITTSEDPAAFGGYDGASDFNRYRAWTVATRLDTGTPAVLPGDADHDDLGGRNLDDNHPQYSLVDGTRAFTGEVAGVTPTVEASLATKGYVDGAVSTGDHGDLTGLDDAADHTWASLVDGTRAFTGTVSGVTPTSSAHLATKGYVDGVAGTSADDTHIWRPLLDDDGGIVVDDDGSAVMAFGPA